MKWKKWTILFMMGIILGAMQCSSIVGRDCGFSELLYALGFGGVYISKASMGEFVIAWLPILFFQVWLGSYIYEHYCVASVYFFSRCTKRVSWYIKEVGKLYLFSLIYVGMLILGAFLLGSIGYHVVWDDFAAILLFYYVAIYSAWLFATTLLVNIIGILWDSSKGFVCIAGFQIVCTALYGVLGTWLDFSEYVGEGMEAQRVVLKLIPVSNLVLKWHSNHLVNTPIWDNIWGFEYECILSVIGLQITACVVLGVGIFIVKTTDFLDNGKVM